jgi:hypothetical protein
VKVEGFWDGLVRSAIGPEPPTLLL